MKDEPRSHSHSTLRRTQYPEAGRIQGAWHIARMLDKNPAKLTFATDAVDTRKLSEHVGRSLINCFPECNVDSK